MLGICLLAFLLTSGCSTHDVAENEASTEDLFELFKNPSPESRPFMRWWWNGDCIEVDELQRELDVMQAAGIGGVEINPIARPDGGDDFDFNCYEWLSPEWNERVKATVQMARERGMIVDMIMGSGWPFGGRFLNDDRILQGVGIKKIKLSGPKTYTINIKDIWQLPGKIPNIYFNEDAPEAELFFLQMVQHGARGISQVTNLLDKADEQGKIEITVPEGNHDLYIGSHQKGYRVVSHGAPGSDGPVLDHYDAEAVRFYMDRLADALEAVLGGKLGDHIRALFCDSIELSGANFTDDLIEQFRKRRGYDLTPFIPFVFYYPYSGYNDTLNYAQAFVEDIKRIRYDYNKTLVELFLDRFTQTFHDWAHEHHMLSRYQSYGNPWLMGILDGYAMVDIPESNNWIHSLNNPEHHGFGPRNKYTSSGAHLSGASIASSETMTTTKGVFRITLGRMKKDDDFNFITGINHSVLHGYNYSPPEAGFPGWVRYGAYYSDQNTWWPYFRYWSDYNARLSAVFQNSKPVTDIAIFTPEADIWQEWGLYRRPFYGHPSYQYKLWEGFSRVGVTADYINENVIQKAWADKGLMKSGAATYKMIIVSETTSIEPRTAAAFKNLAERGVRIMFIDHLPHKSPSYYEKEKNDLLVSEYMKDVSACDNVQIIGAPNKVESITTWAELLIRESELKVNMSVTPSNDKVYFLKHKSGNKDILFISNQDDRKTAAFTLSFAEKGKTAWLWEPHTGERHIYPAGENGELKMQLQPLESSLIVLDDKMKGESIELIYPDTGKARQLGGHWQMYFSPVHGEPFKIDTDILFDFGSSGVRRISAFAGQVTYQTSFDLQNEDWTFLDLGLQEQITEVMMNGQPLGLQWWGRHLYHIGKGILQKGENILKITYTTTLGNYANSLSENRAAKQWIDLGRPDPMGLKEGDVRLLKAIN
jgi:hypothetical protein